MKISKELRSIIHDWTKVQYEINGIWRVDNGIIVYKFEDEESASRAIEHLKKVSPMGKWLGQE